MSALVFVDTNVFLYALDATDRKKQEAARRWRDALWESRRGRISFQVLQEFYVQAIHKQPAARDQARAEIRDLLSWEPIAPDAELIEQAWKIQDRYRFSFWDSLIVSAAKVSSCGYLLTEDLQSSQDVEGILIVNPFLSLPESILNA